MKTGLASESLPDRARNWWPNPHHSWGTQHITQAAKHIYILGRTSFSRGPDWLLRRPSIDVCVAGSGYLLDEDAESVLGAVEGVEQQLTQRTQLARTVPPIRAANGQQAQPGADIIHASSSGLSVEVWPI